MNIVRKFLLLLFMTAVTNTSFAGLDGDGEQDESEPDCDYITRVDASVLEKPRDTLFRVRV